MILPEGGLLVIHGTRSYRESAIASMRDPESASKTLGSSGLKHNRARHITGEVVRVQPSMRQRITRSPTVFA
jgi:hypothetical protein